jgi:transposase
MIKNDFYVYIYFDPSQISEIYINNIKYNSLPIYVGKGRGSRYRVHIRESLKNNRNSCPYFYRKLRELKRKNIYPEIIKIKENMVEEDAFKLEIKLINNIGRKSSETGPLYNLTEGGEGISDVSVSDGDNFITMSEHIKKRWSCDVYKKKVSNSIKISLNKPDIKNKISNNLKKSWSVMDEISRKERLNTLNKCVKNYWSLNKHHSDNVKKLISQKTRESMTIERREKLRDSHKKTNLTLDDEIIQKYLTEKFTMEDLSKQYNLGEATINRIMKRNNIKGIRKQRNHRNKKISPTQQIEIIEKYYTKKYSQKTLASLYNVSSASISRVVNPRISI